MKLIGIVPLWALLATSIASPGKHYLNGLEIDAR